MAGLGWVLGAQAQLPCPDWFCFQTRRNSLLVEYVSMKILLSTIPFHFIHFIHGHLRCASQSPKVFSDQDQPIQHSA